MSSHFYYYFHRVMVDPRAALAASLYGFVLVFAFLDAAVKHVSCLAHLSCHLVLESTVVVSFRDSVLCL